MTPHIAFNTETAVKNMVKMSTENLISFKNAGVSDNELTK
jgi:lactate dehydrogenase-like 2-hydroxyacid dehydrogenase